MSDSPSKSLFIAVTSGDMNSAKSLIDTFGLSSLESKLEDCQLVVHALENGNPAMAKLLLISDTEENTESNKEAISEALLNISVASGYTDIVSNFIDRTPDLDIENFLETLDLLTERNTCINVEPISEGTTALHLAVKFGHTEIVKILANSLNVNALDEDSVTPLHLAAETDNVIVVNILIDKGANVNAEQDDGCTPLHIASETGNNEIVKLLIENNADLDALTNDSSTSLHLAAAQGHCKVVETLVKFGASIDYINDNRKTALHLAAFQGSESTVKILLANGAKDNLTFEDFMMAHEYVNREILNLDTNDESAEEYEAIAIIFQRHAIEILTREICKKPEKYNSNQDIDGNYNSEGFLNIKHVDMKTEKIGDSNVNFNDVINADINQLAKYARNEIIVNAVTSSNFKVKYPLYYNIIERCIKRGINRKNLVDSGTQSLSRLFGHVLPDVFTVELVKYLNNKNLENLTNAYPSDKESDS